MVVALNINPTKYIDLIAKFLDPLGKRAAGFGDTPVYVKGSTYRPLILISVSQRLLGLSIRLNLTGGQDGSEGSISAAVAMPDLETRSIL